MVNPPKEKEIRSKRVRVVRLIDVLGNFCPIVVNNSVTLDTVPTDQANSPKYRTPYAQNMPITPYYIYRPFKKKY